MKKVSLLLLTALLLFTTACSGGGGTGLIPRGYPTDNTYHPETDCSYTTASAMYGSRVAETELGYYTFANCYLLFTDAKTMETVPVCAKPNCLHEEEPDEDKRKECNAYFKGIALVGSVFYVDDSLYIWHKLEHTSDLIPQDGAHSEILNYCALTQVSIDGTQRKTLFVTHSPGLSFSCIHRGRFYTIRQVWDESGHRREELWSYSLKNPSEEPICLFQSQSMYPSGVFYFNLFCYGNYLYVRERIDAWTETEQFRILNLLTNEWTVLENPEGKSARWMLVHNGSLLAFYGDPQWSYAENLSVMDADLYRLELDGSNPEFLGEYAYVHASSDNEYLYMTEPHLCDRNKVTMYIYDRDMNLVDSFDCDYSDHPNWQIGYFSVYPMRGNRYIYCASILSDVVFGSFDRSSIGSGSIQAEQYFRFNQAYDYQSRLVTEEERLAKQK